MDPWGWEHLRPWLEVRIALPVGPLLCVLDGPTRGRPGRATPPAPNCGASPRRPACGDASRRTSCATPTVELAHEGVPLNVIQRQLGHTNLGVSSIYL